MRRILLTTLLAGALALTGCLDRDIKQVLYLEAEGGVTWELTMRLNDKPESDGPRDSATLRAELSRDMDEFETELLKLGAETVSSQVLRDQPPRAYVVRGTFADAEPVLETLFEDWPGLRWETAWEDGRKAMRFAVDPDAPLPDDLLPLEIVTATGSVGKPGQVSQSVRVSQPGDWHGLTLVWQSP